MLRRGSINRAVGLLASCVLAGSCWAELPTREPAAREPRVGPAGPGAFVVPTEQVIHPPGKSVAFHGRPVDLAVSVDGKTAYAKSNGSVLVIDTGTWTLRQEVKYPQGAGGASMHGLVVSPDGKKLFVSLQAKLLPANFAADGSIEWLKPIAIEGTSEHRKGDSYPCGIALLGDDRAAVCLSMNNTLAIVNLAQGKVEKQIDVGVAPYGVAVSADGAIAFVSNWGGRRAKAGDKTADSAGTDVVVNERGTASTGNVGVVDLKAGRQIAEIETGLHPADVEMSADGKTLFVANANSDTVSIIDTEKRAVRETINVRPDEKLLFGSASNALALSKDSQTLYVANGGNNAVAVVDLSESPAKVRGFIPTGWYPGAVVVHEKTLLVANVKGIGSRDPEAQGKWGSHAYWGTVQQVGIPDAGLLARYTKQVEADALVPQTLRAWEKAQTGKLPVPVPERVGEPSVIEHVLYIIKENRTYDQIFGDMPNGNGDPKLCTFGKDVTPNHHAIASQFALLDNFYCNGVLSADGHAWAMEGLAVDYLEKGFGGWSRSYPFPGDDALAIAPTGFIWDNILLHGLTFRNFGEMSTCHPEPVGTWTQLYQDWKNKTGKYALKHTMANATLTKYSNPDSPGWNMRVTDQLRADIFLRELAASEKSGQWANLNILYLPEDHTMGTNAGSPTPEAMVADNDLAVGRVVEAVSKSKFWAKTCIFVIEDDPQNGFDHVDGHRSICLVVSPYAKRQAVVSQFYNQTSVLHTIEQMLGCPPMHQFDAMAPLMKDAFTEKADLTPYQCVPNVIPLDKMNPAKVSLSGETLELAEKSEKLRFDLPDLADEDTLNRIVWSATRPGEKYPVEFAGAHGKGLKSLHLKLDHNVKDDDDD